MKLDEYQVTIIPGNEQANGQVFMEHGTPYVIALKNGNRVPCDARIEIDGKEIGTWRLSVGQLARLERPGDVEKKFVFFRGDSPEGHIANLGAVSSDHLGLISVTFTPQRVRSSRGMTVNSIPPWEYGGEVIMGAPMAGAAGPVTTETTAMSFSTNRATLDQKINARAGGTGLGEHSAQQFTLAPFMELDEAMARTIHVRLVEGPMVSELSPQAECGPIATPIPPKA